MTIHFGAASWSGDLRHGMGTMSTESAALRHYPFSALGRYGEAPGANPEELIGAAHAACFTMSLVRTLGTHGFEPALLESTSQVVIEPVGAGFAITHVHLSLAADIPGIDEPAFQALAEAAKAGCPVSKLMNTDLTFEAHLVD